MATVKAPLMSLDASGTVAGSVVFSKWKGRNYVRRHAVPANPKASLQVSVRAMMRFLTQDWTNLSAAQKADWDTRAAVTNISPFNAFVAYNMDRYAQFNFPSKLDPAAEGGTLPTYSASSLVAEIKAITVSLTYGVLNDAWGFALFRGTSAGFTKDRSSLIRCIKKEAVAATTFLDKGLTTGQDYWYGYRAFTDEGDLGGAMAEDGPTQPT